MGRRGPPKTPTTTLKLRGSWRGEERKDEPEVSPEIPACPAWVSDKGRQYWNEVAETLLAMQLIGKPYTVMLGLLVDALADYVERSRRAAECELYVETAKGMFPHPIHGQKDKAWLRVLRAVQQFGMSPASVASVTKLGGKQERKLDKFKIG